MPDGKGSDAMRSVGKSSNAKFCCLKDDRMSNANQWGLGYNQSTGRLDKRNSTTVVNFSANDMKP